MDEPQVSAPVGAPKVEEQKAPESKVKINKKLPLKKILMVLLGLLLLAGSAYGGYWYRDRSAKKDSDEHHSEIEALEKKVEELEAADETSTEATDSEVTAETSVSPTADQLANIEDSISSGNTAALEGRMATSVNVVIAASEGLGARTITQAIGDLDYVIDLNATWDFSLSAATLDGYAAGDYAQYFPDGALVGKSSEDKVVSFIFDADAKIKTIFMSVNSDIL